MLIKQLISLPLPWVGIVSTSPPHCRCCLSALSCWVSILFLFRFPNCMWNSDAIFVSSASPKNLRIIFIFVGKESTCLGKTNHNSEKLKNKNWYRLKRLHSINCIYDNEDSSLILTRRLHTFEHYQGVDFVIRFREQLIEAIFTMWRSWQMWTTTLINQLTHNLRFHWLYGRNSKFSWVWTYQKRENMLTSR